MIIKINKSFLYIFSPGFLIILILEIRQNESPMDEFDYIQFVEINASILFIYLFSSLFTLSIN